MENRNRRKIRRFLEKREKRRKKWKGESRSVLSWEREKGREKFWSRRLGSLGFLCLVYAPLQQTDKKRRASRPTEFLDSAVGWWSLTKRRMVCGNRGSVCRDGEKGGSLKRVRWREAAGPNGSHSSHFGSGKGTKPWGSCEWIYLPLPLASSLDTAVLLVCTPISTWNSLFLLFLLLFLSFLLDLFPRFFGAFSVCSTHLSASSVVSSRAAFLSHSLFVEFRCKGDRKRRWACEGETAAWVERVNTNRHPMLFRARLNAPSILWIV